MKTAPAQKLCGCMKCQGQRVQDANERARKTKSPFVMPPGFRYNCEICGNKRCPHHSNHRLACTNSNEPGQPGGML